MDKYYNKTIEEARQNFDIELKRLYSDGQKLEHELYTTNDKLAKQDKELENYFKAIPQSQHMTNIEIGSNERPEYATKRQVPTARLISIDEDDNEQQESSIAQGIKRCHVMEKKEIDNDEMQGVTSTTNGNNVSMHEKNFETTRKRYYAKINLNICKLPKEEIETRISQVFNKERFSTVVLNKNGNQYLYVIFATIEERMRLTNSINITNNVGKFYEDQEMDTTIEDPLKMIVRDIPIDHSPSALNADLVAAGIGTINRVLNNPPTSMNKNLRHENILLNVKCNDVQLADTWSIPIKGNTHRISITPCNLTQKQKEERKRYSARIIDVDNDIDYTNVHDLLTEAKAKLWYIHESNKQEKRSIQVYFKNGRDRDNAIRIPCIINNKNFTWIKGSYRQPFQTDQRNNNNPNYRGQNQFVQDRRGHHYYRQSDRQMDARQGQRINDTSFNPNYQPRQFQRRFYGPRYNGLNDTSRQNQNQQSGFISNRRTHYFTTDQGFRNDRRNQHYTMFRRNRRDYNRRNYNYNEYTNERQEQNGHHRNMYARNNEVRHPRPNDQYNREDSRNDTNGYRRNGNEHDYRRTDYDNDRRSGNDVHYGHRY
ncbi:unnamed protein product [Rhizophagus irregularis]|nr:unnamed protein product [Rhizophagus irregularis]